MEAKYTLSANALFSLIDSLYPNPDDTGSGRGPWGPYGPGGPVSSIASLLSAIDEVMLNPQPLPPRWSEVFSQSSALSSGPSPDPWRASLVARFTAAQMVAQLQFTQTLTGEQSERVVGQFRANLREVADDWCGTPSGHVPPRPGGGPLSAAELIAAGAQFARLADGLSGHPLQDDFTNTANQLVQTALNRLEQGGSGGGATG